MWLAFGSQYSKTAVFPKRWRYSWTEGGVMPRFFMEELCNRKPVSTIIITDCDF